MKNNAGNVAMYRLGVECKWMSFEGEEHVYAEITFSVIDDATDDHRDLFVVNGIPRQLSDWINESSSHLLQEDINDVIKNNGFSIAEKLDNFYESLGDDDVDLTPEQDVILGLLDSYKVNHSLRFAFRGSNMPLVYMGLNKDHYEISCNSTEHKWVYEIDLQKFIDEHGGEITA